MGLTKNNVLLLMYKVEIQSTKKSKRLFVLKKSSRLNLIWHLSFLDQLYPPPASLLPRRSGGKQAESKCWLLKVTQLLPEIDNLVFRRLLPVRSVNQIMLQMDLLEQIESRRPAVADL